MGAAERAALFAAVPSCVYVLDVPPGTLISRAGDVRDEGFVLLRGKLDVDGIETLGPGETVGETAFLSGAARACDVRTSTQKEALPSPAPQPLGALPDSLRVLTHRCARASTRRARSCSS